MEPSSQKGNDMEIKLDSEGEPIVPSVKKGANRKVILVFFIIIAIIGGVAAYFFVLNKKDDAALPKEEKTEVVKNEEEKKVEIDKNLDTDKDKLPDYLEKIIGTDKSKSDTDGDSYDDLIEIKNGYNPLNEEKYAEEEWRIAKEMIRNEDEEFFKAEFGVNIYPKNEIKLSTFLCGSSTVSDVDNSIYNTVQIGSQCWLKQNLKVTKNPEGKKIDRDCYNNDPDICETDGGLYTWLAAMNIIISDVQTFENSIQAKEPAQGICPDGWHIPRDSEWSALENYLEKNKAETASGSFMSCSGADGYWLDPCGSAGTKLRQGGSSGFEAVYAGSVENTHSPIALPNEFWYREYLYKPNWEDTDRASKFNSRGESAHFWSSTSLPPRIPQGYPNTRLYEAWFRKLSSVHGGTLKDNAIKNRGGMSVRCLKD